MIRTTSSLLAAAAILLAAPAAFAVEGDYNGDGVVDDADKQILMNALRTQEGDDGFVPAADHNGDGFISVVDLGHHIKLTSE